jgi:hypothetical protein
MNFIYLLTFLLCYLFVEFNNKYKINIRKINKYYNKVNYKLKIFTIIYDFSYENIFFFSMYLVTPITIYIIFLYKLSTIVYCINLYKDKEFLNKIYNITDFIILSIGIFASDFSIMSIISSVLLIFSEIRIY